MSWEEDTEVQTVHLGGTMDNSKHCSGKARESVTQGSPSGNWCFWRLLPFPGTRARSCNRRAGSIHLCGGFSHPVSCSLQLRVLPWPLQAQQGSWSHHPAERLVGRLTASKTERNSVVRGQILQALGHQPLGLTLSWSQGRSSVWGCSWVCGHVSAGLKKRWSHHVCFLGVITALRWNTHF